MQHCKLQIGCLIVLIYISAIYFIEYRRRHQTLKETLFDELLLLGMACIAFDGATAYTVNNLETVNPVINKILHLLFFISLDLVIYIFFLYMLHITDRYPKSKYGRAFLFFPFAVNIAVVVYHINSIVYVKGTYTNYSSGTSVYACFLMAAVYILLSLVVFFRSWKYIEVHKRTSIFTYLTAITLVTAIQMRFPELLITSIAVTILVIGVYMNAEDPALKELSRYHTETVMSFANLIESRDSSTGGHIKRTSRYAKLIADELVSRGYYSDILTKDYISNMLKAAPMHDIGKISVPDAILCKPGKLADEEFEIMKLHAPNGGKIIDEVFGNLGDDEYRKTAYEVARYHHERWDGKGYPDGIKENDIPLCARIMAVADVFDAVSEKRCYRDAMPLDKCFEIIAEGSGKAFDPLIAEIFLDIKDKVEAVHGELAHSKPANV